MNMLLSTKFQFGQTVNHKTNKERKYIIVGFIIGRVNEAGEVIDYLIQASAGDDVVYQLTPEEIEVNEELQF